MARNKGLHVQTAHARCSIRLRYCWAKSAMAELKERHGLRRAAGRGQATVRIQAWGAAIAYNVKKLARFAGQRLHEPAQVCQPRRLLDTVSRPHGRWLCRWSTSSQPYHCLLHRLSADFGNRPHVALSPLGCKA